MGRAQAALAVFTVIAMTGGALNRRLSRFDFVLGLLGAIALSIGAVSSLRGRSQRGWMVGFVYTSLASCAFLLVSEDPIILTTTVFGAAAYLAVGLLLAPHPSLRLMAFVMPIAQIVAMMLNPHLGTWGWTHFVPVELMACVVSITVMQATRLRTREAAHYRLVRAEQRQAEGNLQGMLNALPDLFFRVDVEGTMLEVLSGAERMLAAPASELEGKRLNDFLPPEVGLPCTSTIRRAIEQQIPLEHQYQLEVPAGRLHFEARIAPIGDGEAIAVVRDITEQAEATAALGRTEQMLRQAQRMEAVGRLAGGIAHDFNNLLTVVSTSASELMDELPADSYAREDVDAILEASRKGAALTHQLLSFSRTRQHGHPQQLDLNQVIRATSRLVGSIIGEQVELSLDLEADATWVEGDRSQLEQLLMNLVLNARDAMPDGGTLHIRTRREQNEDRFATLPDPPTGPQVELLIRDSGVGIASSDLPHIFEPFFTTKEVGEGTGLGLATVYGIVQHHRGRIWVDSAPGLGTRFHILLPAGEPARQEEVAPAAELAALSIDAHLLLVEDEPTVRKRLAHTLRESGYLVHVAEDGIEALTLLQEQRFDLVVSDVVMPRMGGLALAREVRRSWPDTRLLLVTGYADDALDPGLPVLRKPFTSKDLLLRVESALTSARLSSDAAPSLSPLGGARLDRE